MNKKTKDSIRYFSSLVGNSIYLREVQLSDVNDNYFHWMTDPEITQYLESRFFPISKSYLQNYVKEKREDENSVFFSIILKENHHHIGNIKLGPIDWIHRLSDIGIIIGEKECFGKGYATEAIGLLIEYAFNILNLHKLTAGCYAKNKGTERAFTKNGFKIEGIRKKHLFFKGRYTDAVDMGLINKKDRYDE